ncbi:hypothetical protein [uncultured Victivallis sp.]|uniref:hypothetical protein n=1 Tax=uncultured Victivallis sp. TaxID=354118 RepID=UPI0025FC10E3|nr:hypothetical protein [uncultured Victivallis sp.]
MSRNEKWNFFTVCQVSSEIGYVPEILIFFEIRLAISFFCAIFKNSFSLWIEVFILKRPAYKLVKGWRWQWRKPAMAVFCVR